MKTFISTRNQTTLALLLLFLMGAMVNSATAQQYPAKPFYSRVADNTVYNLQIQIRNSQVELSSILNRARFIHYSPQGYQKHMAHVRRLQAKINYLQRQLNLRIQIRNSLVELSSILNRARFVYYSPQGYQQHMAHVRRLQAKINYLQRQL